MLLARAPMRISLAGGGTDLEAYYGSYGGLVISTAINKYFYAILSTDDADDLQVISADYRSLFRHSAYNDLFWNGDLALPKAVLHHFGIRRGLNLFVASEVPPGTGLGSSSAAAVTMVRAISSQGVTVEPLNIAPGVRQTLERRLMLFFTGSSRESTSILKHQRKSTEDQDGAVLQALHNIKQVAVEVQACLEQGDLDEFARLLDYAWREKRRLAPGLSTGFIDECYDLALQNGASGGKITGAGGGGFLLLYCHEHAQDSVTGALEDHGLKRMNFRFDQQGATVVLNFASFSPHWVVPYAEPQLQMIRD